MAKRKVTKYIVVHCSATKPNQDIDAKDIDRWHRQFGWSRIGYAFVIKRDGNVEVGRGADEIGAHVKGYNDQSLGICMVGGIDEDGKADKNYTDHQWYALRNLITVLKDQYPEAEVLGHRDFPNVKKDCPCFDVREWWNNNQNLSDI